MEMASKGVLALFVSWHGFPTDKTEEEDKRISRTWYKVGTKAGDTDTWFYHDMHLRVMPALEFIKSRREWNQKDNLTRPP